MRNVGVEGVNHANNCNSNSNKCIFSEGNMKILDTLLVKAKWGTL